MVIKFFASFLLLLIFEPGSKIRDSQCAKQIDSLQVRARLLINLSQCPTSLNPLLPARPIGKTALGSSGQPDIKTTISFWTCLACLHPLLSSLSWLLIICRDGLDFNVRGSLLIV